MQSDHLAVLNAYNQFDQAHGEAKFGFARERFLGIKTLHAIASLKRQLLEALSGVGLAPPGLRASRVEEHGRRSGGSDGVRLALGQPQCAPQELLGSILIAALHPRLAYLAGGNVGAEQLKLQIRDPSGEAAEPQLAALHPSSVNSRLGGSDWAAPFVCFHECVRTTKLYVRDCTPAPLLAALAFCGADARSEGEGVLSIDGWLRMRVEPARAAPQLLDLRAQLGSLVQRMVARAGDKGTMRSVPWQSCHSKRPEGGLAGDAPRGDTADMAPLVRAIVALFRQQAAPEAGAAKKKAPKKKKGVSKRARGAGVAGFVRRFGERSFFEGGSSGGFHEY